MKFLIRKLMFGSLVAGFLACFLWPFFWCDIFYLFERTEKLLIAISVLYLTKFDVWCNRAARIYFILAVIDVLKELNRAAGLHLFWDPEKFYISEYIAAILIAGFCLIGYRGLFLIFLFYILNFNTPCLNYQFQRKMN